jgi:hypothetical protein
MPILNITFGSAPITAEISGTRFQNRSARPGLTLALVSTASGPSGSAGCGSGTNGFTPPQDPRAERGDRNTVALSAAMPRQRCQTEPRPVPCPRRRLIRPDRQNRPNTPVWARSEAFPRSRSAQLPEHQVWFTPQRQPRRGHLPDDPEPGPKALKAEQAQACGGHLRLRCNVSLTVYRKIAAREGAVLPQHLPSCKSG